MKKKIKKPILFSLSPYLFKGDKNTVIEIINEIVTNFDDNPLLERVFLVLLLVLNDNKLRII